MKIHIPQKIIARFWSKVPERTEGACWIWTAGLSRDGYGQFWVPPKMMQTHRVSFLIIHGEIPDGMSVLHNCDVRNCVNPSHLFLGTHLDNMRDCAKKGRINPMGGAKKAKLNRDKAHEIREIYSSGITNQNELASRYSVSQMTISLIVNGKLWAKVL